MPENTNPDLAKVRLIGRPDEFVAFVTLAPGQEETRIRYAPAKGETYKCDACGAQDRPQCPHAQVIERYHQRTYREETIHV